MSETTQIVLYIVVTMVTTLLASSGLWALISKHLDRKSSTNKLLLGLAHDRIIYLGMHYVERGYITRDEYENLHDYLFIPYKEKGGNGAAQRVMYEVDKLPIRNGVIVKTDTNNLNNLEVRDS